ncbi:hypothetical protein M422DRAFT_34017 [Sphaerobolus stellatus SS14]|uniref:Uncharacterized protein n=1 Tax=Sphaerobolus stellatus (strain SS14) TaxID=990650 RepID=A0A0C9VHH1_SPHS4|nr:hypothetical protein M422DRAFT_34017 [Sphaerobolus stellatus SS14]
MRKQRSQSLPPAPYSLDYPHRFGNGVALYDAPVYLHTSTFRSGNLELSIRSPRVRYVNDPKWIGQSIPVFSGKDSIGGTVLTSISSTIATEHLLVISIEGAFFWSSPTPEEKDPTTPAPLVSSLPSRLKHTFLSSLITISLLPDSFRDTPSSSAPSTFRSALQASIKRTFFRNKPLGPKRKRRASESSEKPNFQDSKLSHAFSFPLPKEAKEGYGEDGRDVPASFAVSHVVQSGHRGRWYSESANMAYKIVVSVKPKSRERPRGVAGVTPGVAYEEQIEIPIFIEPEEPETVPEPAPPDSWDHYPFTSRHRIGYACVLSLPSPATFSRFARIPFYIFVTTQPKSSSLAQKLIRHATIRVTLVRRIHLDAGMTFPAPEPRTRHPEDGLLLQNGVASGSNLGHVQGYDVGQGPGEEGGKDGGKEKEGLLRRVSSRTPKIFKWNRRPPATATHDGSTTASASASAPNSLSSAHRPGTHFSLPTSSSSATHSTTSNKPLPAPPPHTARTFEDVLCAVTAEGFPRRVARRSRRSSVQPEVIANSDGVLRADLALNNELLNTVGWCGIAVDYFVEASVYFEDGVSRLRAPIVLAGPYRGDV